MKTRLLLGLACAALIAGGALAQDRTTTTSVEHADGSVTTTTKDGQKDNSGTVGGAAGGAIAGAVVAGPIGALVGGIAGATVGHTVATPPEVRTNVTTPEVAPVAYQGQIEVGKRVDGTVVWMEVPKYPKYLWARLNHERVGVDDNHDVVAVYTN